MNKLTEITPAEALNIILRENGRLGKKYIVNGDLTISGNQSNNLIITGQIKGGLIIKDSADFGDNELHISGTIHKNCRLEYSIFCPKLVWIKKSGRIRGIYSAEYTRDRTIIDGCVNKIKTSCFLRCEENNRYIYWQNKNTLYLNIKKEKLNDEKYKEQTRRDWFMRFGENINIKKIEFVNEHKI